MVRRHPTPICLVGRFPYTDVIYADEHLDENLRRLSERLGIDHPHVEMGQKHSTGAKSKIPELFKGKAHLVLRLLKIFDEDCRVLPKACEVGELLSSLEDNDKTKSKISATTLLLLLKITIQKHKQQLLLECVLSHQCSACRYERINTNFNQTRVFINEHLIVYKEVG